MAKVIASLTSFLTALTISAFWLGLTRQQMTLLHFKLKNIKFSRVTDLKTNFIVRPVMMRAGSSHEYIEY